jgi:hypothetical protein
MKNQAKMITKIQISMREDTRMIRSMDMESFSGVLEVNTKEIM